MSDKNFISIFVEIKGLDCKIMDRNDSIGAIDEDKVLLFENKNIFLAVEASTGIMIDSSYDGVDNGAVPTSDKQSVTFSLDLVVTVAMFNGITRQIGQVVDCIVIVACCIVFIDFIT